MNDAPSFFQTLEAAATGKFEAKTQEKVVPECNEVPFELVEVLDDIFPICRITMHVPSFLDRHIVVFVVDVFWLEAVRSEAVCLDTITMAVSFPPVRPSSVSALQKTSQCLIISADFADLFKESPIFSINVCSAES